MMCQGVGIHVRRHARGGGLPDGVQRDGRAMALDIRLRGRDGGRCLACQDMS